MSTQANAPLKIGNVQFDNSLIQAPLAGISCAAFRALFSYYRQPAYAVTEMISAQSILKQQTLKSRYLARSEREGPWAIQLSGYDAAHLREATLIAEAHQPDLIDLNCGCPKPKIRGKGSGSALMDEPKRLAEVVSAMRSATNLPLTVKIRVAGQTQDRTYIEAAKVIEACGADAIIVHGRHHTEGYDVAANYHQIAEVVDLVNIPVIANGDVSDPASMAKCFAETNACAIMVARGSIGKPWLFKQLLEGSSEPDFVEIHQVFKEHINQLALLEASEHTALLQARRLLKWYFPALPEAQLADCYQTVNLQALYDMLAELNLAQV